MKNYIPENDEEARQYAEDLKLFPIDERISILRYDLQILHKQLIGIIKDWNKNQEE